MGYLACALLLAGQLLALAADAPWIGYGGPNGSRVYAECTPPTKWTDKDIKWEAALPTWGHGSPMAVKGKVFVMCETGPDNVFPLLVCLDGETGKILWRREIDHLPAITDDADARAKLRADLKAWFDRESEIINAPPPAAGKRAIPGEDRDQGQKLKTLYAAMGLMHDNFRRGPYANGYACFGDAFGTPVSDGERVYAQTAWGGFACFDLDGKQQWVAYARGNRWTWCNVGRSPILYKDLLISNNGGTMRAFDKRTGKLVWSHEDPEAAYSMVTPAVITVGGKDILLAAGPSAYLLPDGAPLTVKGWVSEGQQILVKSDERDVAFFCGAGEHCGWQNRGNAEVQPPACFRFGLDGDTLTGTVLWHGADLGGKPAWGNNSPWMVYHDGKLYHVNGVIVDARTGKPLAGSFARFGGVLPWTGHLLCIAGGHIYGLNDGGKEPTATMGVCTLEGKRVAATKLVRRQPDEAQQAAHTYCTGNPKVWMSGDKPRFSYGNTFTFEGERIYVRSIEGLICIGK